MEENKKQKKVNDKKLITPVIAVILFLLILILSIITGVSTAKASNLAFLKYKFYSMATDTEEEVANKRRSCYCEKFKVW